MNFVFWLVSHIICKAVVVTYLKLLCHHSPISVKRNFRPTNHSDTCYLVKCQKKGFTKHNIYVIKHGVTVIILMFLPDYDKLRSFCQTLAQNSEKRLLEHENAI
jgi:hypothetical protein